MSPKPFQRLLDFPFGHCRNMQFHATKHDEYLAVIPKGYNADSQRFEMLIYRFSASTNHWTEEVMAHDKRIDASAYKKSTHSLYIMTGFKIEEINLRRCNISSRYNIRSHEPPEIMLFIRGELHIVRRSFGFRAGQNLNHLVFSKSMKLRTFSSSGELFKKWFTQKSIFSESRNSIIVYQRKRNHTRLIEYRLATNQWNELLWSDFEWNHPFVHQGTVMTLDGRYFFSFGGVDVHARDNSSAMRTDRIVIYDFKRQKKDICLMRCPFESGYHAVLLGDQEKEKLVVFGYVNAAFKEVSFRDVPILPLYLIELMAKWYQNERICFIARNIENDNHWCIEVDSILKNRL